MDKTERILQDRYTVQRLIGSGGMGSVYLGIDQRFGTNVAIKETVSANERMRKAFEHEAQLLNSLRHPALPRVVDYFVEGDGQFIVMEYIAGEDLSEILKRHASFAVKDVLKWADDLLDALIYLHTQSSPVVHRDIKPQNLKLTPSGEIILLDFGLAKGNPGEHSHLTMTTSIFGYSRAYASLEQIQGTGTDPRSDLYSLSSTLYHLLTNRPPVDALTRAKAVLNGEPDLFEPIKTFNQNVPPIVTDVLHQALALNANLRPQSALEMRLALKNAILQAKDFDHAKSETGLTDVTQITSPPGGKANHQLKNVFNASKIFKARSSKIKIPIQPPSKQSQLLKSSSGKSRRVPLIIGMAAVTLIIVGGAFKILNHQIVSLQEKGSSDFQLESSSNIIAKEEISPTSAANPTLQSQPNLQTTPVVKDADFSENENEKPFNAPLKTTEQAIKASPRKTRLSPASQAFVNRKVEKNAVTQEPALKQPQPALAVKPEIKADNPKKTGLKGFLNKIGSGALFIPKSIFKKKKD